MSFTGRTFILDSQLTMTSGEIMAYNTTTALFKDTNNTNYGAIDFQYYTPNTLGRYYTPGMSPVSVYTSYDGWGNENYRTITFITEPEGYTYSISTEQEFEAWLQAHATEVIPINELETITIPDGTTYHLRDDRLPSVDSTDNGKFLTVQNGAWAATTMATWQGGSY